MKEMKVFLHIVGAIALGIMIAGSFTFPVLAIGMFVGYIAIQEIMGSGSSQSNSSSSPQGFSEKKSIWERQDEGTW